MEKGVTKYDEAFEERFILEYLKDTNATAAAVRAGAGGTRTSAGTFACKLLARADIQERIAEAQAAQIKRVEVSGDQVLRELLALATVDISSAFDENGALKPIHEIPIDVRKAIAGIDVEEEWLGRGEARAFAGYTKKVKFWDRTKALEMLGRYAQLFKDTLELTGRNGGPIVLDTAQRAAKIEALLRAAEQRRAHGDMPPALPAPADGSDLV